MISWPVLLLAWAVAGAFADEPEAMPMEAESIEGALPLYDAAAGRFRNARPGEASPPLRLLLSRSRYWRQDRRLDVVVQLEGGANPSGPLEAVLRGREGRVLARYRLASPPSAQFIFYPEIPASLEDGEVAELEVRWLVPGKPEAVERRAFHVKTFEETAPRTGRIRISLPNPEAVRLKGLPVTVGIPFPRGAVESSRQLRLVSVRGNREIPLQVKETARWAKFGSLKWVLCDFTADLDGKPVEYLLEYSPKVSRKATPDLKVQTDSVFPKIDTGTLLFGDGLSYRPKRAAKPVQILKPEGLQGAFVQHEDGTLYRPAQQEPFEVEQVGPVKVVLRREGWYGNGEKPFCRYITRYVIFRDSPLLRLFHTWIFTGDGNRDRIRDMGWRFATPESLQEPRFLTSFSPDGRWAGGKYLLQFDYDAFEIREGDTTLATPGGRAAGVIHAKGTKASLTVGMKDFWQSFPSELEAAPGALVLYNWPRHNKPRSTRYDSSLPEAEWILNAVRVRFAHEGELLDFRLPQPFVEEPLWGRMTARHADAEGHWLLGRPETANAQGISRTEEMWLYAGAPDAGGEALARLFRGLNDETLRAVVDPKWVAASGAFHEIHPQDWEKYPAQEKTFALIARAPARWIERLGLYGKWIYGDIATWKLDLEAPGVSLYRAYRSRHHGWPYSWVPYARSGDSVLLKAAEAATRRLIDAKYCHYVSEEVARQVEPEMHRRIGIWSRSVVPWTGRSVPTTRNYESKVDFLWHAYYLTGYERARENALSWGEQTRKEENLSRRGSVRIGDGSGVRDHVTLLQSYLEMYEATFEPWYLVAVHALAEGHLARGAAATHFWVPAERDYLRFTGDERFREHYLRDYLPRWAGRRPTLGWPQMGAPMIEANATAWWLTGEDTYLRRVAHYVDLAQTAVLDDPSHPEWMKGYYARPSSHMLFEGYYLQLFPVALAVLDQAATGPVPIANAFQLAADAATGELPTIALRKEKGKVARVRLSAEVWPIKATKADTARYTVSGPGGEEILSGDWKTASARELELSANLPAGVYRLRVTQIPAVGLDVPVGEVDFPEVIELPPGAPMPASRKETQFWFKVPEGVEEYTVRFPPPKGISRLAIWKPGGELAWDFQYRPAAATGEGEIVAHVRPAPGDTGHLWRLTISGASPGFRMAPQIPPFYATSETQWFDPRKPVVKASLPFSGEAAASLGSPSSASSAP